MEQKERKMKQKKRKSGIKSDEKWNKKRKSETKKEKWNKKEKMRTKQFLTWSTKT